MLWPVWCLILTGAVLQTPLFVLYREYAHKYSTPWPPYHIVLLIHNCKVSVYCHYCHLSHYSYYLYNCLDVFSTSIVPYYSYRKWWFFLSKGTLGWYYRSIEQNCFSYFLSMQSTNRGHLAAVALIYCQEVMAARWSMLVHCIGCKEIAEVVLHYISLIDLPAFSSLASQRAGPSSWKCP